LFFIAVIDRMKRPRSDSLVPYPNKMTRNDAPKPTQDDAAKKGEVLFELPIGSTGNVVCTRPKDKVYLITFTSAPDNRLTSVRHFTIHFYAQC